MPVDRIPEGFERVEIRRNQRDETIAKRVRILAEGDEIFVKDRTLGRGYFLGIIKSTNIDRRSYVFELRDEAGGTQNRTLFYRNLEELAFKSE
jgi:hypothetical protein